MNYSRWCLWVGLLLAFLSGCAGTPEQRPSSAVVPAEQAVAESPVLAEATVRRVPKKVPVVRHGFSVVDFRAKRDEYDRVMVIGEVKNVSPGLRGVELQALLRDDAGRLVAVAHFYPASEYSISPNETWPFAYSLGKQAGAVKAELRIVGSFRTIEIVNATVL